MKISLARQPAPYATGWLCQCCAMMLNNNEPCDSVCHPNGGQLDLLADEDVTPGLMASEHGCEDFRTCIENGDGCETRSFSSARCDGCGTFDAGYRDAITFWR